MDTDYDAVIVGSGIAGLVAGALLSKRGEKILVAEKNNHLGGYFDNYERIHTVDGIKHSVWNCPANHLISGFTNEYIQKINKELSGIFDIDKNLKKLPELFRLIYSSKKNPCSDITIPNPALSDKNAVPDYLINLFPQEKKNIPKYFNLIENVKNSVGIESLLTQGPAQIWEGFKVFCKHPFFIPYLSLALGTAPQLVGSCTDNKFLKRILLSTSDYYIDDADKLSSFQHALGNFYIFEEGGFQIVGAPNPIIKNLVSIIHTHGGEVRTNCPVTQVIADKKDGVKGVQCNKEKISSDYIIINAPWVYAANNLLNEEFNNLKKKVNKFKISETSAFQIVLGLEKDIGIEQVTTRYIGENVEEDATFTYYPPMDKNNLTAVIGRRDKKERYENSYHSDRQKYLHIKNKFIEESVNLFDYIYPGLKESIICVDGASAWTMEKWINSPHGSFYGIVPNKSQVGFARPTYEISEVKGLYIASSSSRGGIGFTTGIMNGGLCADKILWRKYKSFG